MASVEIEQQISFFSFGFARVSEVRHMYMLQTDFQVHVLLDACLHPLQKSVINVCFALGLTVLVQVRAIYCEEPVQVKLYSCG